MTVVIDKNLRALAEDVWAAIKAIGGLDRCFPSSTPVASKARAKARCA